MWSRSTLPMKVTVSRWHENSAAVERGPLVYALRMEEEWKKKELEGDEARQFGNILRSHFFHAMELCNPCIPNSAIRPKTSQ